MDMTMVCFHGSSQRFSEITDTGVFGGVFGTSEKYPALSHGAILHVITSPRPLTDFELNYVIEGAYEKALEIARGDERVADAIMSAACPAMDQPDWDYEFGWELQRLRGKLAARLGYTSVEMLDEHGTTWLCLPGCDVASFEEAD